MGTPPPARTIAYGPDPAQVYDVREPSAPATQTCVVVVHGGFWREQWDRSHAAAQAQAFADLGHHVAVLEYRRTGMPGGGWPGTFRDVLAGVASVRADASLPERTVLVGHSAGGHLVALVAAQPEAQGVAGVVALAGCTDLALTREQDLGSSAALAFMGTQDASAWELADPARHSAVVPVILVHGDEDDTVPIEISQSYLLATQASPAATSAAVELRRITGAGHFDVIEPGTTAFAEVVAAIGRLSQLQTG